VPSSGNSGTKLRLLEQMPLISIVDDDESVRDATKSLLRSFGYTAQSFGSAEEFLDSARIEETDCLVTDVQMPGLTGVELQDRLLSDGHDVPTIFISAYPSPRLEQQVLKSGAIAYLRKPLKEEELLEYIGAALKRRGD
jgi:FixJ family two-component response regulator